MGVNAKLFWILSVFFVLLAVVYTVWTLLYGAQDLAQDPGAGGKTGGVIEYTGSIGLLLAGAASALIAFYVGRLHSTQGGVLPEDRLDANIDDGDAEQGFFSPWSWWPVTLAAALALVFLGVAVGFWIAFIGAGLLVISLVGWVYEYYRGNFAH
ncbi:cytochrome c oxidase subunit 4 [Conyzicola sp.]|uniref:aa3-type cytochrome oxidase subunit IV n=1 Tax=Conyzicola sp. TaxID=1969404 RepID=UPI003989C8E7